MGAIFSKVIYDSQQAEIAKVNRENGTLFLNPVIWDKLPSGAREFVLLHEKGHLELKTTSEFEANKYAVKKFAPVKTLTNAELGKRIVIMKNILSPQPESGFLEGVIQGAAQILPVLGIGSNSRVKEAAANADAQAKVINAQASAATKSTNNKTIMIVAVGAILILIVTVFLIFKK